MRFRDLLLSSVAVLSILFSPVVSHADNETFCQSILQSQKKLEDFAQVKITNFNVKNLFEEGKFKKKESELIGVANGILRQLPHIAVLEEIDRDGPSLKNFAEKYLMGLYHYQVAPSPDPRGIAVAFLVRKDFPVDFTIVSHREEMWHDPIENKDEPLFQRDFPLMAIYPKGEVNLEKAPLLGIFGVHFKSKRDREGDPESRTIRRAEAERARDVFRRYIAKWGPNTPLMISGDFNGVVDSENEFTEFRELEVDNSMAAQKYGENGSLLRGTHLYWPRGGNLEVHELDYIFINKNFTKYLLGGVVDRHKLSRTDLNYTQLKRNIRKFPSDHFSVSILLSMPEVIATYRGIPMPSAPEPVAPAPTTPTEPAPTAEPTEAPDHRAE